MAKKIPYHYYYHGESDSLWGSFLDFDETGDPDGCTEPISKERAFKLKKELGMDYIPLMTKEGVY